MSKSERITKAFFWVAFGAFLAMSIPHVAWVFRFYEPRHDGYDIAWWGISYGVAISIDLLICWLSYTRSEQQATKSDGFVTWAFILLLALLSWYCNWLFAESMIGVNVWSISLAYGWTVGSLTPLIVSAIPMFMIAYTYMSKKIIGATSHVKSAQELKQENDELEATLTEKSRRSALKNQQLSTWISGKKQVLSEALSRPNDPQISSDSSSESPQNEEPIVSEINEEEEQELPAPVPNIPIEEVAQEVARPMKYFMDFEEASAYTGYAVSTLMRQLKAGEIEANKNGDKLKVSTLKIKTGTTAKMPVVKVDKIPATNGVH